MASWNPEDDVILTDSEDEEDGDLRDYTKGREAILFIIDAGMLGHGDHLKGALNIVRKAFISALLVNDKDLLGVMFSNTEHSPMPIEANCLHNIVMPGNCAVLLPLRQLSKAIVEYLLQFVKTAANTFEQRYGCARGNFANMIRLACNLFDHCGYQCNNSTIVYLTDEELPHAANTPDYRRALLKAKDLGDQEVEFHVIPMVDDFNYDLFYKEFLTLIRDVELDSFDAPDARQLREILADRKLKQDLAKRTLCNFNFSLGPGLDISAQMFNYFKKRSYPRKVQVMRVDNSIVKKKRKIIARTQDVETLEYSQEREISSSAGWYKINVGNAPPIRISTEQMNRVRNLHLPGMLLLGFKPISSLPQNLYYRPCNFMYPNDQRISGSKRLFRALWQRCYERQKIAICLFISKRKSMPRYVALVPVTANQAASITASQNSIEYKALLSGDGFKIVYLPLGQHIRRIDFTEWNSMENASSEAGVERFEKIIKKLRMKYQPNLINDPLLELLQAQLLALALDIPSDNGGRTDMPDAAAQDERISTLLSDFDELFGEDAAPAAKKRAATGALSSEPKLPKITEDDVLRYDFVEQLIANNTLNTCTVAQLRKILDTHFGAKAPAYAKKQALIDRIMELKV